MSNAQRALVAVVFVLAVIGGGALAFALVGGNGDAGTGPSPAAATSPTAAPPTEGATASESAPASDEPSASEPASPTATPSPSSAASVPPPPTAQPTPTPTTAPGQPTVIVVTALKLDAEDDPGGQNRRISFRSQGAGAISTAVRVLSPQGNATFCLSADGDRIGCRTAASGTLTAETTTRRADFVLTLRGEGIETPVVEVTITFPARTPTVTIRNARFDGTLYPETNGLQVLISPRSDGDVRLTADWGGKPFNYEVDLLEQGGPGTHVLANQGPATGTDVSLPVTAGGPWKLLLQNINEGFGITPLDATIRWP